jgi:redox-sensitive bicupin YhaK (pirin superfamily)
MKRRSFLKGSAIVGAVTTLPGIVTAHSGMYSSEQYRKVKQVLKAGKTMVGTLPILRAFAGNHTDYVSPFVLFDEFGPVEIKPGTDALKVEAHPHAGVTPTTYFLEGSGHHKDSLNYDFQINTGEFMMFNSGSGAIHMEESGAQLKENGGTLHGFQIWLNMPSKYKWTEPTTLVHKTTAMPTIMHKDFEAKIIMGSLFNYTSAVETLSPTFYYHIKLKPNSRLDIPTESNHNAFVYNINGILEIEDQKKLNPNEIALYHRGKSDINFYSKEGAEFFILGGQPLNETVYSYGPFVMNNAAEINKCILNYNEGKMGDPDIVNL